MGKFRPTADPFDFIATQLLEKAVMPDSHVVLSGSKKRLLFGSRLISHCNVNERVELALKLRRKQVLPRLDGRLKEPIRRVASEKAYGARDADLAKVKAVMHDHCLEIFRDDQATRTVEVAGPIKVLDDLFQVKFFEYEHASRNYRGRSGVVPDVAAQVESDGRTWGYFWVLDGQVVPNGRTSAAALHWAAMVARINAILETEKGAGKQVGYLTPGLYQVGNDGKPIGSSACRDITVGDNVSAAIGGFRAGPWYDAVTGWGSPVGVKPLNALRLIV
jgi:hypothetical protein